MKTEGHLYRQIADRLAGDIRENCWSSLPPASDLCARYGVSPVTMLKAMRVLRDKSTIEFGRGRGAVVCSSGTRAAGVDKSSSQVVDRLSSAIRTGELKIGDVLEKVEYYAREFHASRSAVCRAFRVLDERRLVHKEGKRWHVGAAVSSDSASVAVRKEGARGFVIVVAPHYSSWRTYQTLPHNYRFYNRFREELNTFGLDWIVVFDRSTEPATELFPIGMDEASSIVASEPDRFRGMLVAGTPLSMENWHEWLARFSCARAPAVFYCLDGTARARIADDPIPKNCYRVFFDEQAAERLVMRQILERGHRKAVYVRTHTGLPMWQTRRFEDLMSIGQQQAPPVGVEIVDEDESFFAEREFPDTPMMRLAAEILGGGGARKPTSGPKRMQDVAAGRLKQTYPSVLNMLRSGDATIVIAPNDWHAANLILASRLLGVRIPRDISLISFDNDPLTAHYPITTVDLGLTRLAYRVAHLFIGDIPTAADHNRNMISEPFMSDRGSVGPPSPKQSH